MKKPITILVCCALLAPLAFAQPESKGKAQGAGTTEEITVTGTVIKMTSEEGSAANYQPAKTLLFARIVPILRAATSLTGAVTSSTRMAK